MHQKVMLLPGLHAFRAHLSRLAASRGFSGCGLRQNL
jgi:hypothetical protein